MDVAVRELPSSEECRSAVGARAELANHPIINCLLMNNRKQTVMNNRKKYCTVLPILCSVMQNRRHTHKSGIPVKILCKLFPILHRTFPQPLKELTHEKFEQLYGKSLQINK